MRRDVIAAPTNPCLECRGHGRTVYVTPAGRRIWRPCPTCYGERRVTR